MIPSRWLLLTLCITGCATHLGDTPDTQDWKLTLTIEERPLPELKSGEAPFDMTLDQLCRPEKAFIEDLRMLRGHSKNPESIWKISDGYLAAYIGGEFGGLLVHYSQDGSKRTFILNEHVDSIARIDEHSFFCTGGCAHLGEMGWVHVFTRTETNAWKTKRLFISEHNIPGLRGRLDNGNFLIRMSYPSGIYYEVNPTGWMKQHLTVEVVMPPDESLKNIDPEDLDPNNPFAPIEP